MERIYHTYDKWECYPAGFYEDKSSKHPAMTKDQLEKEYGRFLSNDEEFSAALQRVMKDWPNSCEHYLSNPNMNRLAWLGQASACVALGIPSAYRSGFSKLPKEKQDRANKVALVALNQWLVEHGDKSLTMDEAKSKTEMNLY